MALLKLQRLTRSLRFYGEWRSALAASVMPNLPSMAGGIEGKDKMLQAAEMQLLHGMRPRRSELLLQLPEYI